MLAPKTVELKGEFLGAGRDPFGNDKIAFEARTTINRKDFGLNWNAALETGGAERTTVDVARAVVAAGGREGPEGCAAFIGLIWGLVVCGAIMWAASE